MKYILSAILFFLLISTEVNAQTHVAKIVTNMGTMRVMLYDSTPLHRDNFIKLVKEHIFDSLLFHRVIKGFVIQAGDPTSKYASDTAKLGDGDLPYTIPAEIMPDRYYHKRGALGAARDENPAKASSASQFYIVQGKVANDSTFIRSKARTGGYETPDEHKSVYRKEGGIPHLDSRYTVFGELIDGWDVLDKISAMQCDTNDRPKEEVRIISIRMVK